MKGVVVKIIFREPNIICVDRIKANTSLFRISFVTGSHLCHSNYCLAQSARIYILIEMSSLINDAL